MVQQWEDVDEERGTVHADLQPARHQAQQRAELVIFVMEALTQNQRADDVWHGVADQRGQIHTGSPGLLIQSRQLCFGGSQASQDAGLQTQLAQAEVSQRGVAELPLLSPDGTIRCEDYSYSSI